jgi:hypothetical protein
MEESTIISIIDALIDEDAKTFKTVLLENYLETVFEDIEPEEIIRNMGDDAFNELVGHIVSEYPDSVKEQIEDNSDMYPNDEMDIDELIEKDSKLIIKKMYLEKGEDCIKKFLEHAIKTTPKVKPSSTLVNGHHVFNTR